MIGAILGVISVAGGLYSAYQQNQTQGAMDSAINEQNDLLRFQQIYAQDKYQNDVYAFKQFQNDFGGTMQNLKSYYDGLTADVFSTQLNDAITQKFKANAKQYTDDLALRNVRGGAADALLGDLYAEKSVAEAQAAVQAPQMVADQQAKFQQNIVTPYENTLRNQQNTSWQNYMGAGNTAIQGMNTQISNLQNQANQYGAGAQSGIQGGFQQIGQAYDAYNAPQQNFNPYTGQPMYNTTTGQPLKTV